MIKVVCLSSVHPSDDVRIFHKECKSLSRAGYEVVLVIPHDRDEVIDGIRIRAVRRPRSRLERVTQTLRDVLQAALAEGADIYHFHDPELIVVGLLLKAINRVPVIYDVHEHNPDAITERGWIPAALRQPLSKLFDRGETLTSRAFDAIITADDDVATQFRRDHPNVTILYNFPLRELYPGQPQARQVLAADPLTLVYVGVMGRVRGLWLMLETMEILVGQHQLDVELVLVGRIFDQREQQMFQSYVAESPVLSKRVRWSGPVPQAQVPSVLANADIGWAPLFSIPKFHKNIPTKVFEYMASALPIVASDLPPIRRFVEPAVAGRLAEPEDPASHAAQVAYLAQCPDEARQMGANGRKAFLHQFNWDSEARKLVELYDVLID